MTRLSLLPLLALGACYRPADNYDVHLYSPGGALDEVLPEPTPMGGQIEYARLQFWGTNLGTGLTGLYGDAPRSDGAGITMGYGFLAYPLDTAFDRVSSFLSPGPQVGADEDACLSRFTTSGYYGFYEYVDVGDAIALTSPEGERILLERDPATHHRPAGESWYVGYGGSLQPILQGNALLPDNWRGGQIWNMSFPGTLVPPDSTLGAVPYPLTDGEVMFPPDIEGVAVNGETVRPPHPGYNDAGVWTGEPDDVRYPGPFEEPMTVTWTPSALATPVTVAIRYQGVYDEGACTCQSDCSTGFTCEEGQCVFDDGSGYNIVGELVCTVADDGEFTVDPSFLETLDTWVSPTDIRGYALAVGRISEGTVTVPDALTYNGKRVGISPVRTRVLDLVYTRLEAP